MTYRAVPLLALLGDKPRCGARHARGARRRRVRLADPHGADRRRAPRAAASPGSPSRIPPRRGRRCRARTSRPGRSISSGSIPSAPRSAPSCGPIRPSPSPALNFPRIAGRRWRSPRCAPGRRSGAARSGGVHDAMHAVPSHEGRRRRRAWAGSRPADEPDAVFHAAGLRALIRNPKAVRTWPQQQMPAFDAQKLPDADLDAVIAYLAYMAAAPR